LFFGGFYKFRHMEGEKVFKISMKKVTVDKEKIGMKREERGMTGNISI
jgi:hypothetical protein